MNAMFAFLQSCRPYPKVASLLLTLLFIAVVPHAHAQNGITAQMLYEDWRWVKFTTASGLPSDSIIAVAGSKDSTVWVMTTAGPAWYDHYCWNTVSASRMQIHGGSILKQTGEPGTVMMLADSSLISVSRSGVTDIADFVTDAVSLDNGGVLFQKSNALYEYHPSDRRITPSVQQFINPDIHPPSILQTEDGCRWMICDSGLYRRNESGWEIFLRSPTTDRIYINCIAQDSDGDGCLSVRSPLQVRGLWEWKHGEAPGKNRNEKGDLISSIAITRRDGILHAAALYRSRDFLIRDPGEGTWNVITPLPQQMKKAQFFRMFPNGDLWAGTKEGLFLFRASASTWTSVRRPPPDKNRIHELFRARDGSLWLGTADGIEVIRPDGTISTTGSIRGVSLEDITGIAQDSDGVIWISSGISFPGAYGWTGTGWIYEPIWKKSPIYIHKIRTDRMGRLWFLGLGKQYGLGPQPGAYLMKKSGTTGRVFIHYGRDEGLLSDRIYDLAQDRFGRYWFATLGVLSRWSGSDTAALPWPGQGRWDHWSAASGNMPFPAGAFSLTTDSGGGCWFADRYPGIGRINPNDSLELFLTSANGFLMSPVWSLRSDAANRIWIGTEAGLNCYEDGIFRTYDVRSGLPSPHIWPILPEGDSVLVGTIGGGLGILHCDRIADREPGVELHPPVTDNKSALITWSAYGYNGVPGEGLVLCRFRMNDTGAWSGWSSRTSVSLTGLTAGTYRYTIQSVSLTGRINRRGTEGVFTIEPPVWRRSGFLVPVLLLIVTSAVLGGGYVRRRRTHLKEKRETERRLLEYQEQLRMLAQKLSVSEENERRRLAAYLHDFVSQELAFCRIKLESLKKSSARPAELDEILSHIGLLFASTQSMTFELCPPSLYELGLSDAIEWLAEEMEKKFGVPVSCRSSCPEAEHLRGGSGDGLPVFLYQSARELLTNAMKHSHPSRVAISLEAEDGMLVLTVEDNGAGFLSAVKPKGLRGFGLFNIQERVSHFGGTLRITSTPGNGASIRLSVPIGHH